MAVREGFDDRDQSVDLVGDDVLGERTHFVLDFNLQALCNAIAEILFGRDLLLGWFDLVDVLHVPEVADVEPGNQ